MKKEGKEEYQKLREVAQVLRRDVLDMTTAAGSGHLSSCLSSAEIMACLFFHQMKYDTKNPFNDNNDELILSKGHAAPLLYSCLYHAGCISDNLLSLRKFISRLEGHPVPSIEWVKTATGSLGQGLSAGVGMALAGKLSKKNYNVYVLLGDSETAEGSVYEALQLASHYRLNNLIAIVDVNRLGQQGETMLGNDVAAYKKRFEGFGWQTLSVDGHNVAEILSALEKAKKSNVPVIILAKTIKGKGVSFIENKNGWHGRALSRQEYEKAVKEIPKIDFPVITTTPPHVSIGKNGKNIKMKPINYTTGMEIATREAYGNALARLAESDEKILVLDGEVSNSTFAENVKKKTPKQFVECFIAEQNMVSMAAGFSKKGFRVFASTFSAFLSRAHDQIRMAGYSDSHFTLCGSHSGVSIGEDGPSQMGLEDIALFRSVPGSVIFYPSDAVSCEKIVELCKDLKGIKYIRTTRPKTKVIYENNEKFEAGDFKVLEASDKDKIVLVGTGITLHESLKAYEELKKKHIPCSVIDMYCIKPFNDKKFIDFVKKHGGKIIVSEDHYPQGGIGEMLASKIANEEITIQSLAVRKTPRSGTPAELMGYEEIDSKSIVRAAMELVKK
ncbi:MAG: transketolase homeolog [archaeon]|jgi:transketolase